MSEAAKPWAPEKCPITQRPLFMWIEHHKTGEMVPTYGGPYDSYTLAEFDGEDFVCERFDHDAGGWLVDCVEGLGVKLVDDQSLVIDPNNTRYDEIEAFAAAPVAAQPDLTQQTLDDVMAGISARDAEIAALRKEIETLKATMGAEPVAVPKGWKLVPIEPTSAMLLAGHSDVHDTEVWWSLMLDAAPAAPVATPAPAFSVDVHGVGIIDDNPSALAVYFNAAPNDDDIRALHEIVSGTPVAAQERPEPAKIGDKVRAAFNEYHLGYVFPSESLRSGAFNQFHAGWDAGVKAAQAQQPTSGDDGWSLAKKVRRDLDRQSCPDAFMRIAVESIVKHYDPPQSPGNSGQPDHLPDSTKMVEPSWKSVEFEKFAGQKLMEAYKAGMHGKEYCMPRAVELLSHAALVQQDADKVDAALAEMVHAMFRSANSIPVTRITIDRKQYEAAIDAARKEQA